MNRRDLVKAAGAGAMSLAGGRLFAAGSGHPRFLLVFLRGGYDAASLLVPVGSSFYYEARRDIAIPRPSADQNTALPLDGDWGLHPALRESIYPMFQKGEAAFIPFAGTPDTSRSHFETQDSIELGQPLDQSRNYRSGFLNRLAATLRGAEPMAFTDQLPLVFQGTARVPNTALKSIAKPSLDVRQSQIISAMYQNTALASAVNEGFTVRDEVMREMSAEMDAANRNAISAKGFELESRRIARLMKERYSIGFVDVGGWDTHVNQGAGTGYLAGRFDELAEAWRPMPVKWVRCGKTRRWWCSASLAAPSARTATAAPTTATARCTGFWAAACAAARSRANSSGLTSLRSFRTATSRC